MLLLLFACYYVYLLYLLGFVQRVQPSALKKTLAT